MQTSIRLPKEKRIRKLPDNFFVDRLIKIEQIEELRELFGLMIPNIKYSAHYEMLVDSLNRDQVIHIGQNTSDGPFLPYHSKKSKEMKDKVISYTDFVSKYCKPLKCYVLRIAKNFPSGHINSGQPTGFREAIPHLEKIHTLREGIDHWKFVMNLVQLGQAYISVREWQGKAFKSKMKELYRVYPEDGAGIEIIESVENQLRIGDTIIDRSELAINDGLSLRDFDSWFRDYDFSKSLACIHFTEFRYALNNNINIIPNYAKQ